VNTQWKSLCLGLNNLQKLADGPRLDEIGPMPACFSEQGGSHRRGGCLMAPQTSGEFK